MSRIYRFYLDDILESCRKIRAYTDGMDYVAFSGDEKTIDAVVRNLEILGEAVKNISEFVRETKPDVEWTQIARFRDIIAHHYFKIRLTIVWDVIENHIEPLESAVEEIVAEIEQES